jgi:hypothetical protein
MCSLQVTALHCNTDAVSTMVKLHVWAKYDLFLPTEKSRIKEKQRNGK